MKTLVFYTSSLFNNNLDLENRNLLCLASIFASTNRYKVITIYEAPRFYNIDLFSAHPNLKILSPSEFDPHKYKSAIYITSVNQLLFLLKNNIAQPDSKIFLFSFFYKKIDFFTKINKQKRYYESLSSLLSKNNALYSTCPDKCFRIINFPFFTNIKPLPFKNIVHYGKEFNICYFNDINDQSITSIQNIIRFSEKLDYFSYVNIHVIGRVFNRTLFDYLKKNKSSSKVRLIFPKKMTDANLANYLSSKIDVVFTYGQNSFSPLCATLPVVIAPIVNNKSFENKYIWLNEALSNYDAWNNNYIYKGEFHTFESIIFSSFNDRKRVSELCKSSFLNYAHFTKKKLDNLSYIIEHSTLTVRKCLDKKQIGNIVENYQKKYYDVDFNQYVKELNNKKIRFINKLKRFYHRSKSKQCFSAPFKLFKKNKDNIFSTCRRLHFKLVSHSFKKLDVLDVAFLVTFNESFSARPIFEYMLKTKRFNPYIIVTPNVARSYNYQISLFDKTYQSLRDEYGDRVIKGFEKENNTYLDLKNNYQLVFFSNPYKHYDYKKHNISYFSHKKVLPIYVNYAYSILDFCKEYFPFYNKMWRVSFENDNVLEFYKNVTGYSGDNAIISGCIKMDKYCKYKETKKKRRKTILICPHHTVYGSTKLNISNFLRYKNLFQTLPKKYPNIDFIFRPHPLLWTHIKICGIWNQKKIDAYISELKANKNLIYDDSAEYFDKFAKSDAMIHDCGSFIAEYLYTGKPCCYMIRDKQTTYSTLMPYGKKCMDAYYLAYEENDIINFIERVVLKRKDPLKQKRVHIAKQTVAINYPKATEYFINKINDDLK